MKLFNSTRILYLKAILIAVCFSFLLSSVRAQVPGEFRSATSGNWNVPATWETYNGNAWVPAGTTPTFSNPPVTILAPHIVTVTAPVTVDETVVQTGATFEVSTTGSLTINNGTGVDLIVNGTFSWFNGTLVVNTGAQVNGSAVLQYNIPTLTNNGQINLSQLVMDGTVSQTINGNGAISTLLPFNNTGLNLGGNQTIVDQLSFNAGLIHTGPNKLIIASTALIINADASHYVDGNLEMLFPTGTTTKMYPVGDPDTYAPVQLTLFSVSTAGGVSISTTAGTHPDISSSIIIDQASVMRYWSFNNISTGFITASMTFHWATVDIGGGNPLNYIVGKYDAPDWTYPAVSTATNNSIDVS